MTSLADRQHIVGLVDDAIMSGARRVPACQVLGLTARTLERWRTQDSPFVRADTRPTAVRPRPANRLTAAERAAVLRMANTPTFASLPPSQIVPKLADQGVYLASESTFYRVLKAADQQHHRGRAKAPNRRR